MDFHYDIRQWQTPQAFALHLQQYSPTVASWARGIVIHHTWRPLPEQWRGRDSMQALIRYYSTKGWTAGPHLFIAVGSRNPDHDGIWQLTALNEQGIHAGKWNSWTWGVEVVGDYDISPWAPALETMVITTVATLAQWRGIDVSPLTILGHRECNSPKTCPGTAINMHHVRTQLASCIQKGVGYGQS